MTKQTEALKQALTELLWYEEAGLGRISSCDAIHTVREVLTSEAIEQPAQTATYTCGVCGVSMQMEQPAPTGFWTGKN